jgi:hypothetical protein
VLTADAPERARRVRNAGAVFVGNHTRSAWATTWPAPTTCCPPAAPPASPPGCPPRASSSGCRWCSTARRAWPRSPRTSPRSAAPRTCSRTSRPCRSGCGTAAS